MEAEPAGTPEPQATDIEMETAGAHTVSPASTAQTSKHAHAASLWRDELVVACRTGWLADDQLAEARQVYRPEAEKGRAWLTEV